MYKKQFFKNLIQYHNILKLYITNKMSKYKPIGDLPDCPFYSWTISEHITDLLYCYDCTNLTTCLFQIEKYENPDKCNNCSEKYYHKIKKEEIDEPEIEEN